MLVKRSRFGPGVERGTASWSLTYAGTDNSEKRVDVTEFNVKSSSFGAVGDGTTADHTALQKGLNAACATTNGGRVTMPRGTYLLQQTLWIHDDAVELLGDGWQTTQLKMDLGRYGPCLLVARQWTSGGPPTETGIVPTGGVAGKAYTMTPNSRYFLDLAGCNDQSNLDLAHNLTAQFFIKIKNAGSNNTNYNILNSGGRRDYSVDLNAREQALTIEVAVDGSGNHKIYAKVKTMTGSAEVTHTQVLTVGTVYYVAVVYAGASDTLRVYVTTPGASTGSSQNATLSSNSYTFTADSSTEVITATGHGFVDGDVVRVSNSGGGLPGGLSANTNYWVRDAATNTLKLTATLGGGTVDITSAGTGTHTIRGNIDQQPYELVTFGTSMTMAHDYTSGWQHKNMPDAAVQHLEVAKVARFDGTTFTAPNGVPPVSAGGANVPDSDTLWYVDFSDRAVFTFTVDAGTDVVTATGHSFSNEQLVFLSTTGSLPGGLATSTGYYVRDVSGNTFKLAATLGGSAIDITSTGSGTHTVDGSPLAIATKVKSGASEFGYVPLYRDEDPGFLANIRLQGFNLDPRGSAEGVYFWLTRHSHLRDLQINGANQYALHSTRVLQNHYSDILLDGDTRLQFLQSYADWMEVENFVVNNGQVLCLIGESYYTSLFQQFLCPNNATTRYMLIARDLGQQRNCTLHSPYFSTEGALDTGALKQLQRVAIFSQVPVYMDGGNIQLNYPQPVTNPPFLINNCRYAEFRGGSWMLPSSTTYGSVFSFTNQAAPVRVSAPVDPNSTSTPWFPANHLYGIIEPQEAVQFKTITSNNSALSLFDIALTTLRGAAGTIEYQVFATDSTDVQVRRGLVQFSTVNKGGAYQTSDIAIVSEAVSASAGTLTASWAIVSGSDKVTVRVTPNSSLTTTTYYIEYRVRLNSSQLLTFL